MTKKWTRAAAVLLLAALAGGAFFWQWRRTREADTADYIMSTVMTQRVYGPKGEQAAAQVRQALMDFEAELSLYRPESDIARLNVAAGQDFVTVQSLTYRILQQAQTLSLERPDEFALTIAPLTLAWAVTSGNPRVPDQTELDALLPLVDDSRLVLKDGAAFLQTEGQGVDLGGVAKGAACTVAKEIYDACGVKSALLNIGGNVYAHGKKVDGTLYQVGFRDPNGGESQAIAALGLCDQVMATSGGYERYFEVDGVRYSHIFDPTTGRPAQSDILSVAVISGDGLAADFYSTALFVGGMDAALAYMRDGGTAMVLSDDGTLYVSKSLEPVFTWVEGYENAYRLEWV